MINGVFERALGEQFRPLRAGRPDAPDARPPTSRCVELLVADKGADWTMEGLGAPWRVAEARALAGRLGRLLSGGTAAARDVVLLTRATTDLRVYERALEERGIPTYVIGGRGYWAHPQVIDMVAYLGRSPTRATRRRCTRCWPRRWSGVSGRRAGDPGRGGAGRASVDPWSVLREPDGAFDELDAGGPGAAGRGSPTGSRASGGRPARAGVEELIDRALERTGYDLAVLAMPGGSAPAGQRAQADAAGARARGRPRPGSARRSSSWSRGARGRASAPARRARARRRSRARRSTRCG